MFTKLLLKSKKTTTTTISDPVDIYVDPTSTPNPPSPKTKKLQKLKTQIKKLRPHQKVQKTPKTVQIISSSTTFMCPPPAVKPSKMSKLSSKVKRFLHLCKFEKEPYVSGWPEDESDSLPRGVNHPHLMLAYTSAFVSAASTLKSVASIDTSTVASFDCKNDFEVRETTKTYPRVWDVWDTTSESERDMSDNTTHDMLRDKSSDISPDTSCDIRCDNPDDTVRDNFYPSQYAGPVLKFESRHASSNLESQKIATTDNEHNPAPTAANVEPCQEQPTTTSLTTPNNDAFFTEEVEPNQKVDSRCFSSHENSSLKINGDDDIGSPVKEDVVPIERHDTNKKAPKLHVCLSGKTLVDSFDADTEKAVLNDEPKLKEPQPVKVFSDAEKAVRKQDYIWLKEQLVEAKRKVSAAQRKREYLAQKRDDHIATTDFIRKQRDAKFQIPSWEKTLPHLEEREEVLCRKVGEASYYWSQVVVLQGEIEQALSEYADCESL